MGTRRVPFPQVWRLYDWDRLRAGAAHAEPDPGADRRTLRANFLEIPLYLTNLRI